MSNFQPVSKSKHQARFWRYPANHLFARNDGILPLGLSELSRAASSLVTAFVKQGEAFQIVALMSLWPDCNHYVIPSGQWLQGYMPASVRAYPFRLLRAPDGRPLVCVDEDSGLISEAPEGNSFFDATGEPSAALQEVLAALNHYDQGTKAAQAACAVLQRYGLIKPWPIKVKLEENGEKNLAGLFQVDEAALSRISADALVELRDSGALMMAYYQLLSMQHLPFLGELAGAHALAEKNRKAAELAPPALESGSLDLEFLKADGLNFGGFR